MKTTEKPTYRRGAGPNIYLNKWGRFKDAIACSGLNKSELYRLINEGTIESFLYKFREDAKSGVRLINLESLTLYLDVRAAQAKADEARAEGKEVLK